MPSAPKMVVVLPRMVPIETPVNSVKAGVVEATEMLFAPNGEVAVVVTEAPLMVHSAELVVGAVVTSIVSVAVPTPDGLASADVEPTAESEGVPLQVSPEGSVRVIVEPFVSWSARVMPDGSVIEIGLIAVVAEAPNVTAGTFAETLYHRTLATVGTVKLLDARPEVA